jgi:hypothetical protein
MLCNNFRYHNMEIKLTLLSPTDLATHQITKTYQQQADGSIVKISDYNAGFLFNFRQETIYHLKELPDLLRKYRLTHFLIYGNPDPNIVAPVQRKKDFFPEDPAGYYLHRLDVDGWKISQAVAQAVGWNFSPATTEHLVRVMLSNAGLNWLANIDIVVLLSASQFDHSELRCHIYFLTRMPITLEEMRAVAIAANKGQTQKIMDHQVYKSVQPDYISPPICDNFKDPIPERIMYFPSAFGITHVEQDIWQQFKTTVEQRVGHAITTATTAPKKGANWVQTLQLHAGTTDLGINEPCYVAASQLVNEVGLTEVRSDMEKYVKQLYDTAWQVINDRGIRGNSKDKATYDIAKFRSYIRSAADKHFGSENDELMRRVNDAVDDAIKGNMQPIFAPYCLHAAAKLQASSPGMYATVRYRVKKELRGAVSVTDWEKQVSATSAGPVTDYTALLPKASDPNQAPLSTQETIALSGPGGKKKAENTLMMKLMQDFDILQDQEGVFHLGAKIKKNGLARYNLYPITNELSEFLYFKGSVLTGGDVGESFGKRCMAFIRGALDAEDEIFHRKRDVIVGDRVAQEGDDPVAPFWLNTGEPEKGEPVALKVTPTGVQWVPHSKSPIYWRQGFPYMDILSEDDFGKQFGGNVDALIQYYYDNIGHYIPSTMESRTHVTAWCVAAMMNRPMPYLAELVGPQGSGKSTAANFMKDLIDPGKHGAQGGRDRSHFKGANADFFNYVYGQHVTIIDNISALKADAQDALCQLITGMAFNERILYTHKQRNLYIKRPLIVTSIDEVVTREDLASRALTIHFRTLKRSDLGLYDRWEKDVPIFRRAIIEIVHRTMKRYSTLTDADVKYASSRDVIFGVVRNILKPHDAQPLAVISQELNELRSLAHVAVDSATLLFIAFLQETNNPPVTSGINLSPSDVSIRIQQWVRDNYGLDRRVRLGKDRDNILTHADVIVDRNELFTSASRMGRFISRNLETINRMSGWTIGEINYSRKLRNRSFCENISLQSLI